MEIKAIVAYDLDGNIGRGGTLPWTHMKEDMKHFSDTTRGGKLPAVIMGRKTWESLPSVHRPLKGRINIVISTTMEGPHVVRTPAAGIELATSMGVDTLWVIGGGSIYREFMGMGDVVGSVVVTQMQDVYDGCDATFPVTTLNESYVCMGELFHVNAPGACFKLYEYNRKNNI